MPEPEPRLDEKGVPWCKPDCCYVELVTKETIVCRLQKQTCSGICLPAVQQMAEELERLRNLSRSCEGCTVEPDEHDQPCEYCCRDSQGHKDFYRAQQQEQSDEG